MSLKIIKAGICDTFQDEGRKGLQHLGINPGGVMDRTAAHMANFLAGNTGAAAVLEMHFPAATILLEKPCLLVIAGADFAPGINGKGVPMLQPVWVPADSTLNFMQRGNGSWCYLALYGGFKIDPWINSYSTHLKLGAGGWQGRALQKNDCIPFGLQEKTLFTFRGPDPKILPWGAIPWRDPASPEEIWIVKGPEAATLDKASRLLLEHVLFTVLPASDRMAYSLKGTQLVTTMNEQLVSSAVGFGTLQLLPDGQLMVLMADHQTTGGYPRIGQVIQVHLSKLAQRKPGDNIRFTVVSQQEAQQLWLQQYRHLKQLEYAARFKLESLTLRS